MDIEFPLKNLSEGRQLVCGSRANARQFDAVNLRFTSLYIALDEAQILIWSAMVLHADEPRSCRQDLYPLMPS